MKRFFTDKKTREQCEIYKMLALHEKDKHFSFHTPGHKIRGWDITELSYSDNLSSPTGCIKKAEEDITNILGAKASFILTDGSTSGILAMLRAAKTLGLKSLAFPVRSHKSVYNACELLGLTPYPFDTGFKGVIPTAPTLEEVETAIEKADGLLLTSPDYYGNIPDLASVRRLCDGRGKLLFIDGAHGGHLHFDKTLYAGSYADFWVDGVHKSLPAFTQGAVVSARTETFAAALKRSVDIFRTTSPSYPIMASVEYAVKYPRNPVLEQKTVEFSKKHPEFIKVNADWTKLCLVVDEAFKHQKTLEKAGFYAEFCDGNVIEFYLSPATKRRQLNALFREIEKLLLTAKKPKCEGQVSSFMQEIDETAAVEWVTLGESEGRICARTCGLFPPCVPLIQKGEEITNGKIRLLKTADNTFGLSDGKIAVVKSSQKE